MTMINNLFKGQIKISNVHGLMKDSDLLAKKWVHPNFLSNSTFVRYSLTYRKMILVTKTFISYSDRQANA